MKYILLEDEDFKLEVTEDNYENVRVTHTFKQGIHTDVNELLLSKEEQSALKGFLLKDENPVQTYYINTKAVASISEPERFYLVVDHERDNVVLAAIDYDFSYGFKLSQLQNGIEYFERSNDFNTGELKPFLIQQIKERAL